MFSNPDISSQPALGLQMVHPSVPPAFSAPPTFTAPFQAASSGSNDMLNMAMTMVSNVTHIVKNQLANPTRRQLKQNQEQNIRLQCELTALHSRVAHLDGENARLSRCVADLEGENARLTRCVFIIT
jgi:hypothetical protein